MSGWTAADIPSQEGRLAVVTGANGGVGFSIAQELARAGAHVMLACRDATRGGDAAARIEVSVPGAQVEVRPLDVASLDSVRAFAAAAPDAIDLLINNAGVMATPHRKTVDGFELQLGTNHLGHFALTGLLLERLEAAPAPRVVATSSNFHKLARRIYFEDLNGDRKYSKWRFYGQSKLANLMFALELNRRATEAGSRLVAVAAHPGYASTNLHAAGAQIGGASVQEKVMGLGVKYFAQSSDMGALPTLYAATAPSVAGGSYWGPDGFMNTTGHPTLVKGNAGSRDFVAQRRLWEVSEEMTGVHYEFAGVPAAG